jgi:hypothetical protein
MVATRSDSVISRPLAMSFNPCQNASSKLTLVLWPAITIERLTTGEFIARLLPVDVMPFEVLLGFLMFGSCELALMFGRAVSETVGGGTTGVLVALCALARRAQIDHLGHFRPS